MHQPRKASVAACLALACLAAGCSRIDARPEHTIAYINDEGDASRRLLATLASGLERDLSARYRIRVRHVVVDWHDAEQMRRAITEAVRLRPAVIVATNSDSATMAKALTSDIPIVFGSREDPIRLGLVDSLARPGGNLTGFTYYVPIEQKRFELLREIAPGRRLGILIDHWWLEQSGGRSVLEVAARMGFEPHVFLAETASELARAVSSAEARRMDVWYVPYTVLPFDRPAEVVSELSTLRAPVMYPATNFVEWGGLVSYQQLLPLEESSRLILKMVALVLDGVSPAEIPVERPKSFSLAINLAKAKRLGLRLSPGLIKRADRIVQDVQ